MPSPFELFSQRFGGQQLGAYNPFQSAPQYANTYQPLPFGAPAVPGVPGQGGVPGGGQVPGQGGLLGGTQGGPVQSNSGAGQGNGVGGVSGTNTGGAFGLGQTTTTDRTGGVINTAQNQEPTFGNIVNSALTGLGTVTASPIGLANLIGGVVMNPNTPPTGGLLGGLLSGEGSGNLGTGANTAANAAAGFGTGGAGLLAGGVTTPSTPGMAVPSQGLLGTGRMSDRSGGASATGNKGGAGGNRGGSYSDKGRSRAADKSEKQGGGSGANKSKSANGSGAR